jgi:alpha-beta hydrolase superfamily lysophospholipase
VTAGEPLRGAGGVALDWRWAGPDRAPRGLVLVVHGYAEHLGRYAHVFAHFVKRGWAIAGVDLRGHGRSEGGRGHVRHVDEYVADVAVLSAAAAARCPDVPRVLLGHSMGGLVTLAYLERHPRDVRAAAVTGPALRIPPGAGAPRWQRWLARQLGRVAPRVAFTSALDASALSRDPEVGRAYLADPLVHRRATAGLVRAIENAQAHVMAGAGRIRTPLLVVQGDADRIVDPAAAPELARRIGAPCECVMLAGHYHELLNEPAAERAVVLDLLDRWFDRWLGP